MSSSADYGYDRHFAAQSAEAVLRLKKGVDGVNPRTAWSAAQAFDQMSWKIQHLRLTREEYAEWNGFIESLRPLFPKNIDNQHVR